MCAFVRDASVFVWISPVQRQPCTFEAEKAPLGWADSICVSQTPEQKEKRFAMFSQFDPNGNGYLSLAEVDKVRSADGMLASISL